MAEENEGASKTEEPTPRKLQQAREKGDVAKTPDLPQLASLAASAAVILMAGGWMAQHLAFALLPFIARPDAISLQGNGAVEVARIAIMAAAPILLAVMVAAGLAGAAGNLVQHGLLFTPDKLKPDFQRVSPGAGFKRMFGIDGLAQFAKSLTKVGLTGVVAWFVVKPHMDEFRGLAGMEIAGLLPFTLDLVRRLFIAVVLLFLVIAGADWFWQRQRFMSKMRMTKEELKEDYKQSEGDPYMKARQKQLRNERARRRMMQAVPGATVVVMNPTHFAVALKYDPGEAPAPLCVAKGVDSLALKIRAIAEEAGVPVIEDPPLARALYASVDIDETIPASHYEAVAKIIGFIMQSGRRAAARVQ
jgi:flagellar biosynthetic protein FlhB